MKKLVLLAVVVTLVMSSCSPYVVEGAGPGGCGAWMKKSFQGNKPPKQRARSMPVIN